MRIGIDASCWSNRRGFGRFTRELLTAIAGLNTGDEFVLFADRQTANDASFPEGWRVVTAQTSVAPTQAAASDGRRSIADMWRMRRAVHSTPVDALFFPAVYSYFPVGGRTACLVTFHDVIAETLPHLIFDTRRSRFFWNLKSRLAVRRADLIVTVSQASKQGLTDHFGLADERVGVITEGASDEFLPVAANDADHVRVLDEFGLSASNRFFLYVGGISPHKNLDTLIDAFARFASDPRFADVALVLVGDYSGDVFRTCHQSLVDRAVAAGVNDRVRFVGYVGDGRLRHLYAASVAFVFPSYLEGFGLPAVEAMQCGAAMIASNRGSLPEVVGDAGLLFDPHDAGELAERMTRVVADFALRETLQRKGLERVGAFTWRRAAEQTMELIGGTVARCASGRRAAAVTGL